MAAKGTREASHAGSWYTSSGDDLRTSISNWLERVPHQARPGVRAVIAPHAGYRYSGPVAAHCYKHLKESNPKRVFILGPSHYHGTRKCLLPTLTAYDTPLGPLPICQDTVAALRKTSAFEMMHPAIDEREHSIEMHLPFLTHALGASCRIVPIMVGSLDREGHRTYGDILRPYFDDPDNFFVISSDFMHFGERFGYVYYDPDLGKVHESITAIDRLGMNAIETLDPVEFASYLDEYGNTICGRHPILVMLHAVQGSRDKLSMEFVHYAQSSACMTLKDSSVSYAAGLLQQIGP
ncbi:AmmeMemoRadiSam system protein B [Plasmodiophora brassicae]